MPQEVVGVVGFQFLMAFSASPHERDQLGDEPFGRSGLMDDMLDERDSGIQSEDWSVVGLAGGVRLLLGAVGGGTLGVILFGLAWAGFWPSGSVIALETLLRLSITGLFTASFGVVITILRPIRHWTIAIVVVGLGGVGGLLNGFVPEGPTASGLPFRDRPSPRLV